MKKTQRWMIAGASGALCVALAACGSSPSKSATTTSTTAHSVTTTTGQAIASATITLNGKSYPVPSESPGIPIKTYADQGQQVVLTTSGFLPSQLYSATGQPVVVTNLTPKTVTITVPNMDTPPHVLAPGASFSYTPTALAYAYDSSTGKHALVNVGAFTS